MFRSTLGWTPEPSATSINRPRLLRASAMNRCRISSMRPVFPIPGILSSGKLPQIGDRLTSGVATIMTVETDAKRILAANLETLLRHRKDRRKLRQRHGPTTAVELEEQSGVSDSTISRYRKQEAAAN